jgi:hypothetical protein
MEIRRTKQVDVVVGFSCDICGQNCAKHSSETCSDASEHATLSADWGYWSDNKDLTWHECHMCEACFDKVREFIEHDLRGTVRTGPLR